MKGEAPSVSVAARTLSNKRPTKPQLGEIVEVETLMAYLEYRHRRGTLTPYSDRITVPTGLAEERFDLVREARLVRWQRTR